MSFIKSLKGTFQSVQQDISSGLKSLTLSSDKGLPESTTKPAPPKSVRYDAGAEILQRYQTVWKELYQFSEESAQKAEAVDGQIGQLHVYYDRQEECLARFHEAAANLPVLLNLLQSVTDSLASVEEACDKVESALVFLEDICEEQEVLKAKESHRQQLQAYRVKKKRELDGYKSQLAAEHAKKMAEIDRKKQQQLKERQAAFQDQFTEDLDYYKKHGKPGRLPGTPEMERKPDLAEITIDDDKAGLDEFLEATPDTDTTDPVDETEGTEEVLSGEENIPEIASEITSPVSEYCEAENSSSIEDQTASHLSSPTDEGPTSTETETSPEPVPEVASSDSGTTEPKPVYSDEGKETETSDSAAIVKDIDQSKTTLQEATQSEDRKQANQSEDSKQVGQSEDSKQVGQSEDSKQVDQSEPTEENSKQ